MLDLIAAFILAVSSPDQSSDPNIDPWYTCVAVPPSGSEWDCATAADVDVHLTGQVTYFGPGDQIKVAYDATHPRSGQ